MTELEAADALVTDRRIEISGRLRISIPPSLSDIVIVPLVNAFQTLYPNIFFVEYKAQAYVSATQHTYESRYLARITVKDGKIANYFELWDRDAKSDAFGITGQN